MMPRVKKTAVATAAAAAVKALQGDPSARRRQKAVDDTLNREVPKDAELAEAMKQLDHVQSPEEFRQVAERIQGRPARSEGRLVQNTLRGFSAWKSRESRPRSGNPLARLKH